MQKNRIPHARRIWQWLAAATVLIFFTGCEEMTITNLTPSAVPVNPSQIYTFSARVTPKSRGFMEGSLNPQIVIDGNIHTMDPSPLGEDIYEFDYQIPSGRTEVSYYYLATFDVKFQGVVTPREAYTGVIRTKLQGRLVLSMVVNRGPVGARIGIVGQGFTPQDVVTVNGQPARTVFDSSNSLSFFVPSVPPGRNYQIVVQSPTGQQPVGTFRVDGLALEVFPASLNLAQGETQNLTFNLPQAAPAGGLLLDVTTDAPDSVIMPEVVIPAGSTTVTVPVRGGLPGSGSLFLTGFGGGEVVVPISVR
ncbi:IPT/TIG domain-containing protein [Actomonas aquatica]|uniref:Cell surface protein n=1 Tax=Actomonas aquatica TaxID=2866162 RepID=A0ABZ1CBD9_9BACT|nr:IPT/TIG domain-containing protein [Opitutus sp. WL0086]WRQ88700.1 cell surface protein [Opitutus sp. WL0086]